MRVNAVLPGKGNLRESVSKDISPVQIAKLLPVLKETVENAVGVESHENRYFYDTDTVFFENLMGGYVDGAYLVPVRFGLKHSTSGTATLYVIVDQQRIESKKIKAEITKSTRPQNVEKHLSPSTFAISVPQIIPLVKSKDLLPKGNHRCRLPCSRQAWRYVCGAEVVDEARDPSSEVYYQAKTVRTGNRGRVAKVISGEE